MSTVKEKFISLFPLKGRITQEIIESSDIGDSDNCIGANTFRKAIGDNISLFQDTGWGTDIGHMVLIDDTIVDIGTEEDIDMMEVVEPRDVTFIIKFI